VHVALVIRNLWFWYLRIRKLDEPQIKRAKNTVLGKFRQTPKTEILQACPENQ